MLGLLEEGTTGCTYDLDLAFRTKIWIFIANTLNSLQQSRQS